MLNSISSRQCITISGRPLPERTDFGPAVCSLTQPASHTMAFTPQCSPAMTHYFSSECYQVIIATYLLTLEGWKAELAWAPGVWIRLSLSSSSPGETLVTSESLVQDLTTTFSLSGACQVGVAASMSWCYVSLSKAHHLDVARPELSGRRSSSTVLNQVCLSLPVLHHQSLEGRKCRPEELENGLDWCRQDKVGQRKTGTVDG